MISQVDADSFKVPAFPWPLPLPSPQPAIPDALDKEIPVPSIAPQINEVMETGQHPAAYPAEHGAVVETGQDQQFSRAATSANPAAPVSPLPVNRRIVHPRHRPEPSRAVSQKFRLGRHTETEDRLRNFMVYQRPLSGTAGCQSPRRWLPPDFTHAGNGEARGNPAPILPDLPVRGTRERTLFLLAGLGAVAVIGLASATWFLLLPRPSAHQAAAPLTGASVKPAVTRPGSPGEKPVPSGKNGDNMPDTAALLPPPPGWASPEAYQAWCPKFEVSLDGPASDGTDLEEFSVGGGPF